MLESSNEMTVVTRKERGPATQIVSRPYLIAQATNKQTKPYTFIEKPEVLLQITFSWVIT